jgi:hypothetical protein
MLHNLFFTEVRCVLVSNILLYSYLFLFMHNTLKVVLPLYCSIGMFISLQNHLQAVTFILK